MERAGLLARPLLLGLPLLTPLVVDLAQLPPGLAYAVTEGRWLVLAGMAGALVSLALRSWGCRPHIPPSVAAWCSERSQGRVWAALWLAGVTFFCSVVPAPRWSGVTVGGDEWKYLRMAESLAHDLDVDVGSESGQPLVDDVRSFLSATWVALQGLLGGLPPPADHQWSLGSWTIAGRHGGRYHVQSPGLAALIAPALALQEHWLPDYEGPVLPLLTLATLWATALVQTCRLAAESAGSLGAGVAAGAATLLAAPLLILGYTFYPEAAAVAVVPWALRHARPSDARLGTARATALLLVIGALPWLHPKFSLLGLGLIVLLASKLEAGRRPLALVAALPLLGLVLFDHYVTGLFGFDALYRRYGSALYPGLGVFLSSRVPIGLVNGLFAARDGLLVMAPVLAAGFLAAPTLFRHERPWAIRLGLVFAALWVAAAVHEGGAPGPPGRLLAPVACVLTIPLALGLRKDASSLEYRWVVGTLGLVTLAIVVNVLGHWRKEVNPYRGMFRAETDFARDLPDGRREPGEVTGPVKQTRDVLRGVFLAGVIAFWARRFRPSPGEPGLRETWRRIRNVHVSLWVTVGVTAWTLHALGP
jgi:hypothetical protein